jgi:hypothetical protein
MASYLLYAGVFFPFFRLPLPDGSKCTIKFRCGLIESQVSWFSWLPLPWPCLPSNKTSGSSSQAITQPLDSP